MSKKTKINGKISETVNEIKKTKKVTAIYLFGSRAAGKSTPISDTDICVITDRNISDNEKANITSCSSDGVDVSIFWDLPVIMRYKILKEGKKLFEGDKNFLHNVIIETLCEYLDFKPVVKRFAKVVGVGY